MATPDYAVAVMGHYTGKKAIAAMISAIDSTCEIIVIDNYDNVTNAVRRCGKSEMQGTFIITAALKQEDTIYVRKIETEEKLLWNTNRQRNLRHYPGRRWIDTRTTNK